MVVVCTEYIAAGGNRHPAAADWDPFSDLIAFGADRNIAIWKPCVSDAELAVASRMLIDFRTMIIMASVVFFPVMRIKSTLSNFSRKVSVKILS